MTSSSVESQLLAETLARLDLSDYCLVTADTSVRDAVGRMRVTRKNCAFIIGRGTQLIGILTDRDVLNRVATAPDVWDAPVSTVMTPAPDTLPPDAETAAALRLMEQGSYRNVPVVDQHGTITGNVTHFAILKFLTAHFPQAVYNLPPDPTNYPPERDGG